ncbi:uncharacterized protein BXZ73DRAFT_73597 [Epithele typhae]|uniref:uncharacterized protein n=1 Tax=Epithele typhae TaxID=378194 RepID=UPI002007BA60|nr:uncharacterized protein BXZ73DRAFT_73597 [Epithele typhae]KAH9945451.1 hypothetical protein BXZ73DRAFT_73597 [Epithele typhae]
MKSFSAPLVALALCVAGASAQSFLINTPVPPPVQCVTSQLSWTGGEAPFFLQIVPGGIPGAAALQQYSNLQASPFTWTTNISAGTSLGLSLTDHSGATVQSGTFQIASGPDSSCLNGQAASTDTSQAATGTTGTTAGTTTGTPGSGTTSTTSGGSQTSTKSSSSSSSSSSATGASNNSAAFANSASVGLVGVLGAVAAALLA